jgi:hypothetical protein
MIHTGTGAVLLPSNRTGWGTHLQTAAAAPSPPSSSWQPALTHRRLTAASRADALPGGLAAAQSSRPQGLPPRAACGLAAEARKGGTAAPGACGRCWCGDTAAAGCPSRHQWALPAARGGPAPGSSTAAAAAPVAAARFLHAGQHAMVPMPQAAAALGSARPAQQCWGSAAARAPTTRLRQAATSDRAV